MIFHAHKPIFPLDHFIERLIYFEGMSVPHSLERFLPDGNTEIIIDLAERPQHIYNNITLQKVQTCRYAWVSGVRTQPITIPSGRDSRMLIVAFKKGKAFPFYPFPISELTDIVVEADQVFGRKFCDLREQLLASRSVKRMFHLVETFLLQQADDALSTDGAAQCIGYAVANMIHKPTLRRLHQLSEEIGYSQKHFIALFRQQVGVLPKQYLRIMRFQNVVSTVENDESIRWREVALESGYYDQAHFIHDFKTFSGFTPGEYIRRKTSTRNYIPVA
jgi:AraC-like DNA-binding protein